MNIDKLRNRWDMVAKVLIVLVVGFLVAPFIYQAIGGLVGLAVAGVLGLACIQFTPVISMKFANWKVKGIVNEARENPIETMVNLLNAKKQAYSEFKTAVENAVTARSDFEYKCKQFTKQYPHRADEFNKQLQSMTILVERKKQALQDAKQSLEAGELKLQEMRAYWEMSQAAQEANKAAGMDTGDMYEKLKADTAVDSVFESVNRAFAQLEVAASLESLPGIENTPTQNINLNDVAIKTRVV